jgi:hypothetical protein
MQIAKGQGLAGASVGSVTAALLSGAAGLPCGVLLSLMARWSVQDVASLPPLLLLLAPLHLLLLPLLQGRRRRPHGRRAPCCRASSCLGLRVRGPCTAGGRG